MQKGLTSFFEKFIKKESLFINKKALQAAYTPETIPHRNHQIHALAQILAPCLKTEKPSNVFVYGKTGTGKTLVVTHVMSEISKAAAEHNIDLNTLYVNCKLKRIADTEYRLIAHLARFFGKEIPSTGLPTDEVYKIFFETIDSRKQSIILVLDEIDQLVKKTGDQMLYTLTRINSELKNSQITLVGISNDLMFTAALDPRVKSSLSEEELIFPPYNALQIQEILRNRASAAFQKEAIDAGTIEKCAAYSAREHGDARRALELLRVAGEIAARNNENKITTNHIDEAEEKIERDRIFDIIQNQPKQFQAVLYAVLTICHKKRETIFTGEVYDTYRSICSQSNMRPLTQRRVSDVIAELDMLGVIATKVVSKGRHGRTREISLAVPISTIPKVRKSLEEALDL